MIVISPSELRSQQKKYLELAETNQVFVKKGSKLIELVVRERQITDAEIKSGLSLEEVKKQVHKYIESKF